MNTRKDFIRSTFFGLAAILLPDILRPSDFIVKKENDKMLEWASQSTTVITVAIEGSVYYYDENSDKSYPFCVRHSSNRLWEIDLDFVERVSVKPQNLIDIIQIQK